MKVIITKTDFVNSNLLDLITDVESIFSINTNFGLKGQLIQLDGINNLSSKQRLNILLGRLACITEEWNYKNFNEQEWNRIFESKESTIENIMKEFEPTIPDLFITEFNNFKNYFLDKSYINISTSIRITPNYKAEFKFDGMNVDHYFQKKDNNCKVSDINFNSFKNIEINNVLSNRIKWNWKLWYIESNNLSFLFEEIISS